MVRREEKSGRARRGEIWIVGFRWGVRHWRGSRQGKGWGRRGGWIGCSKLCFYAHKVKPKVMGCGMGGLVVGGGTERVIVTEWEEHAASGR